ncbi:hypothetical protein Mapa_010223 [Marchantia paleacea]|nr:hypothetical protein Mapa_010223 [Marchantia paleacea]
MTEPRQSSYHVLGCAHHQDFQSPAVHGTVARDLACVLGPGSIHTHHGLCTGSPKAWKETYKGRWTVSCSTVSQSDGVSEGGSACLGGALRSGAFFVRTRFSLGNWVRRSKRRTSRRRSDPIRSGWK